MSGGGRPRRSSRAREASPPRFEDALARARHHARAAAAEAAQAARALLDAAALGATGVPAAGHEPLRGALRWLDEIAARGERADGMSWLAALGDALDAEIARWAAQGFDWIWLLGVWCVGEAARHDEFARIHDDALPAAIPVQPQFEDWQTGLDRDVQLDRGGQLQASGARHFLAGQEFADQRTQTIALLGGQTGRKGHGGERGAPGVVGNFDRGRRQAAQQGLQHEAIVPQPVPINNATSRGERDGRGARR